MSREAIVDAALECAERSSWEAVRLHEVAAVLGATLDDVRLHFREKEDIVEAWFDRADAAMLADAAVADYHALPPSRRIARSLETWLAALAPHRRVTRQMILGKLEPGHVHYQLSGLLRVSRTVQWLREATGRTSVLPWRAIEEAALTAIYLATFVRWMYDDSPGAARTAAFLRRQLEVVAWLVR
ncbi:MAG: TetR/AcrR family transcriptional regulator [Sulfurifustaceae bacterium]